MTTTVDAVQITEASAADVAAIRHIAEQTWPTAFAGILSADELATALNTSYAATYLEDKIASGEERFFLLRENKAPVAYASLSAKTTDVDVLKPTPEILLKDGGISTRKLEKLYCLPKHHGKGFGKLLLNHVLNEARQQGVKTLYLMVNRNNPSVGFYHAKGFVTAGELNQMVEGIYREDFVMIKDLENEPHAA